MAEVKALCLTELEGMSKKRIRCILLGKKGWKKLIIGTKLYPTLCDMAVFCHSLIVMPMVKLHFPTNIQTHTSIPASIIFSWTCWARNQNWDPWVKRKHASESAKRGLPHLVYDTNPLIFWWQYFRSGRVETNVLWNTLMSRRDVIEMLAYIEETQYDITCSWSCIKFKFFSASELKLSCLSEVACFGQFLVNW